MSDGTYAGTIKKKVSVGRNVYYVNSQGRGNSPFWYEYGQSREVVCGDWERPLPGFTVRSTPSFNGTNSKHGRQEVESGEERGASDELPSAASDSLPSSSDSLPSASDALPSASDC